MSETLAEAIWEALDRAHDGAWHVHAAECCWSFPGSIQAITTALAAHTPPAPADREGPAGGLSEGEVLGEKRCVFCPIIEGDAAANIVERGKAHIAFVPLGPHVPGHVLFVPTTHLPDATTNPEATGEVFAAASRYVQEQGIEANVITSVGVAATQSVPHLHVHVVPRGPTDGLPSRWPWLAAVRAPDAGLRARVEALCNRPVGYDYGHPFIYCDDVRAALAVEDAE